MTRAFWRWRRRYSGRSTPEGARDYLVPSRVSRDEKTGRPYWYALPQSPQLYKQLLMVAGYDKYFQIARCLRDEDLRADRQPEFTQLDLEMSFVEQDDVLGVVEGLVAEVFQKCVGATISLPLPRLPYEEAMLKFGSDKPDLRICGMEIMEVSDWAATTDFRVFKEAVANGGKVCAINMKAAVEKFSRKQLDDLTPFVQQYGAKGAAWIKVEADKFVSPIEKFLPAAAQQELRKAVAAESGDLIVLVADKEEVVRQALGNLRTTYASQVGVADTDRGKFQDGLGRRFSVVHLGRGGEALGRQPSSLHRAAHEDLAFLESEPAKVHAKAYDLVINGYEVGGGSIRIHSPEVQARLFAVLGMSPEQTRHRFGFLLDVSSVRCSAARRHRLWPGPIDHDSIGDE